MVGLIAGEGLFAVALVRVDLDSSSCMYAFGNLRLVVKFDVEYCDVSADVRDSYWYLSVLHRISTKI